MRTTNRSLLQSGKEVLLKTHHLETGILLLAPLLYRAQQPKPAVSDHDSVSHLFKIKNIMWFNASTLACDSGVPLSPPFPYTL